MEFKVGDKLEALQYDKDLHGLEFVVITSINEEMKVYHWESEMPNFYGIVHSGYLFHEAKEYKEKN